MTDLLEVFLDGRSDAQNQAIHVGSVMFDNTEEANVVLMCVA
jgi:hypothetical protein